MKSISDPAQRLCYVACMGMSTIALTVLTACGSDGSDPRAAECFDEAAKQGKYGAYPTYQECRRQLRDERRP
jgi:hypothetical protein